VVAAVVVAVVVGRTPLLSALTTGSPVAGVRSHQGDRSLYGRPATMIADRIVNFLPHAGGVSLRGAGSWPQPELDGRSPSVGRLGSNTLSGVSLVLPVSFASLFPLPTAVGDFALGETVCTTGATSTAPAPAWGDRCALVCRPGTGSGRRERCVLANRSTQSRSM